MAVTRPVMPSSWWRTILPEPRMRQSILSLQQARCCCWIWKGRCPKDPAGTTGFALNTASRNLGQREAVRIVTRATEFLSSLSLRLIYKKMDSQLRGRPGLEIETLRKGLDLACAFVAPAYPEQGRITRDAVHLVHGIPVAEGEAGKDPCDPGDVLQSA